MMASSTKPAALAIFQTPMAAVEAEVFPRGA
jgi:hypothetical protein